MCNRYRIQSYSAGLQIRVYNWKLVLLFLDQTICCGYSKELSQWDGSFKHPKHMCKLMGKNLLQFYAQKLFLTGPTIQDTKHSSAFVPLTSYYPMWRMFKDVSVMQSCNKHINGLYAFEISVIGQNCVDTHQPRVTVWPGTICLLSSASYLKTTWMD